MRIYHAICELIEAKAHAYRQPDPEPERESDLHSQAEATEGHYDRSLQIGFNRTEEDAFNDPMERQ